MWRPTQNRGRCVLRSSLLVVAILIASAGHAQINGNPQPAAPVVYDTPQLTVEDCRTADPSAGDACVANHEETPPGDYALGDAPDYGDEAPAYDSAPNAYLGWAGPVRLLGLAVLRRLGLAVLRVRIWLRLLLRLWLALLRLRLRLAVLRLCKKAILLGWLGAWARSPRRRSRRRGAPRWRPWTPCRSSRWLDRRSCQRRGDANDDGGKFAARRHGVGQPQQLRQYACGCGKNLRTDKSILRRQPVRRSRTASIGVVLRRGARRCRRELHTLGVCQRGDKLSRQLHGRRVWPRHFSDQHTQRERGISSDVDAISRLRSFRRSRQCACAIRRLRRSADVVWTDESRLCVWGDAAGLRCAWPNAGLFRCAWRDAVVRARRGRLCPARRACRRSSRTTRKRGQLLTRRAWALTVLAQRV